MGPLFRELDAWDEEAALKRLRASLDVTEVWMINVAGQDVGWLQISEENGWLQLHQIHLVRAARGHGIGTCLMRCLMKKAQAEDKRILLAVLPNNRARYLYERLGFVLTDVEGVKLIMQWPGPASAGRSEQSACNRAGDGVADDSKPSSLEPTTAGGKSREGSRE
jgi:GNAT superfamily N-acetyltransferase